MLYMWEVDFDTNRVDVYRWSRRALNRQCSNNADLYVTCRLLTENGRVCLQRDRQYRGYLDFKNVHRDTLVIHVISGEVHAASVVVSSLVDRDVFRVRNDMAGFRAQLRRALII
jgi:hypothetical protein